MKPEHWMLTADMATLYNYNKATGIRLFYTQKVEYNLGDGRFAMDNYQAIQSLINAIHHLRVQFHWRHHTL